MKICEKCGKILPDDFEGECPRCVAESGVVTTEKPKPKKKEP